MSREQFPGEAENAEQIAVDAAVHGFTVVDVTGKRIDPASVKPELVCGWCKKPANHLTAGCCRVCWQVWSEVFQELMQPDATGSPPRASLATTSRRTHPGSN